ncbi:MAG TPA: biotin/lipoyl-containing protein [Desulfitobacteriaceae bacterium]|nr:biotin/lipoyl-containing protein [Desulfitobacteriaceae bacterium]
MIEIVMPRLGLNMEKGTIIKWHVKEGDSFRKDDVLCEVESEKSIGDVTADFDGILLRILVKENEEMEVIKPIAEVEKQ